MKKRYCQFCGKDITKHWPHQKTTCDSNECQDKFEDLRRVRAKEAEARHRAKIRAKRPQRDCVICGKRVELEQRYNRPYCLNPECEGMYKSDLYDSKKEKQRRKYTKKGSKIRRLVLDKPLVPIPADEFFNNAIYEREQKEMFAKVKTCRRCGRKFRGPNHRYCDRCFTANKKIADTHVVEGECIYGDSAGAGSSYNWNLNAG